MNRKTKPKVLLSMVAALFISCSFIACEKSQMAKPDTSAIEAKQKLNYLIDFLAYTLNVKTSEIVYNEADQEFVVLGIYKTKRADVEANYNDANEYHAKFPNKRNRLKSY